MPHPLRSALLPASLAALLPACSPELTPELPEAISPSAPAPTELVSLDGELTARIDAGTFNVGNVHVGRAQGTKRTISARGARVVVEHDDLTEWFEPTEHGFEHGFDVPRALQEPSVEVDFGVPVTVSPSAIGVRDGYEQWRYDALVVEDANGDVLASHFERGDADTSARIVFDDGDATYPVHIDPYFSTPQWNYAPGCDNHAFADFNNDGLGDLAGRCSGPGLSVFFGRAGDPSTTPTVFGTSNVYESTGGDFNGDGFTDIAYIDGTLDIIVYKGGPTGLTLADTIPQSVMGTGSLTAGDFDGDGDSDLVLGYMGTNLTPGTVQLFRSGGASLFPTVPSSTVPMPNGATNWGREVEFIGDTNGDGNSELLVSTGGSNAAPQYVFLGANGTAFLSTPARTYATGGVGIVARFNNDAYLDVASPTGTSIRVYFGSAAGLPASLATPSQTLATPATGISPIGDTDANGLDEFMLSEFSNANSVIDFRSATATGLGASLTTIPGTVYLSAYAGGRDVSGDGLVDAYGAVRNAGIRMYRGWADKDGDGYKIGDYTNPDCDDTSNLIHPGLTETVGDEIDQNCDGKETCYRDNDKDGHGTTSTVASIDTDCADLGEIRAAGKLDDCNDSNPNISPSDPEICDGADVDEDCDKKSDDFDNSTDPTTMSVWYYDSDVDGYGDAFGPTDVYCDFPGTGFTAFIDATDCDDSNAAINPGETEVCDPGNVDENCNKSADDLDATTDKSTAPTYYADADLDGHTSLADPGAKYCEPAAGRLTTTPDDCNDANNAINPAAQEVCDALNVDEDCDNKADDADASVLASGFAQTWPDGDSDGHGSATGTPRLACDPAAGYADSNDDCNDANGLISPSADEVCDPLNVDEDCDKLADDADPSVLPSSQSLWFTDADADGHGDPTKSASACERSGSSLVGDDCNDKLATINPGEAEVCDSLDVDEDCDGLADDADANVAASSYPTFYVDTDGDTYGGTSVGKSNCAGPGNGAVDYKADCDETDATIHPGAPESCDGIDEDCDGRLDNDAVDGLFTSYADLDGDGFGAGAMEQSCKSGGIQSHDDCDDTDASVNPSADDECNGLNDDCVGAADDDKAFWFTFYPDDDGDTYGDAAGAKDACSEPELTGWVDVVGDCKDDDSTIHEGAAEVADDGIDQDCDGKDLVTDTGDADTDSDSDSDTDADTDADSDADSDVDSADTAETGTPEKKCGCETGGTSGLWLMALGLVAIVRRTPRSR